MAGQACVWPEDPPLLEDDVSDAEEPSRAGTGTGTWTWETSTGTWESRTGTGPRTWTRVGDAGPDMLEPLEDMEQDMEQDLVQDMVQVQEWQEERVEEDFNKDEMQPLLDSDEEDMELDLDQQQDTQEDLVQEDEMQPGASGVNRDQRSLLGSAGSARSALITTRTQKKVLSAAERIAAGKAAKKARQVIPCSPAHLLSFWFKMLFPDLLSSVCRCRLRRDILSSRPKAARPIYH